jgi:hypothetical protein
MDAGQYGAAIYCLRTASVCLGGSIPYCSLRRVELVRYVVERLARDLAVLVDIKCALSAIPRKLPAQ